MFTPAAGIIIADRYALIEEIGRGGMGSVWKAQHRGLGAWLAVKFMLANRGADAGARRRFLSEARAAARVQSPYVARVFDVDEWQGVPYIAMEFLEGETLEAKLARGGALSPELTCTIVDQIALGLARAHAARLVHRDLKPGNVFLVRQEVGEPLLVKLLDFGLVKQLGLDVPHATKSGMLLGTPGYMSPEQALGPKAVDERADLWSLAAITYYCLTGREAFSGEGLGEILLQVIHAPLPVPSQVNPDLGAAFDAWWQRAAHRDPAARPRSASLLAKELRVALGLALPPSVASDGLDTMALGKTIDLRHVAAAPVVTRDAAGGGAASPVTIPSVAVLSLSADESSATLVRAAAIPAAPVQVRPDTLQPAIELHPRRRDGLPRYALLAVSCVALTGAGVSYWWRHRDSLANPVRASGSEAIPAARANAELRPAPEALPASPAPGDSLTGPPSPATPAPAEPPAPPMPQQAGVDAPDAPPGGIRGAPQPRLPEAQPPEAQPSEAQPERPVAPPKPRARPSTGTTRHETTAPKPATEKKHERLGF
jgi:hypothetical protein